MNIEKLAMNVDSREGLLRVIEALMNELNSSPESWDNRSLENYLTALHGFAHDMHGYYRNRGEDLEQQSTWQVVADLLMAGRFYE
jgi:flagellar hook protein FlgE